MIIDKPWGSEELIEVNEYYVVKRIMMNQNHSCSLQYHQKKTETIIVIKGILLLDIGENENDLTTKVMHIGDSITIEPKIVHRMYNTMPQPAIYIETSTNHLEDVVRVKDYYNRS
jgi:mannose-6-phosphate isomerase